MDNVAADSEVERSDRNRSGPPGRVERSYGHIQINRGGSASGVRVEEYRIRSVRDRASIHPARRIRPVARLGPATRPADPISIAPTRGCKADVDDRVRAEHREDDLTGTVHEPIREVHGVLRHIESLPARVPSDGEGDCRGRNRG